MELSKIKYEIRNQIGIMTMDYAQNLNAIDESMAEELLYVFHMFEANEDVKVIMIRSDARAFSSGGDIQFFHQLIEEGGEIDMSNLLSMVAEFAVAIKQSKKLVITAVNGIAAGAGASIALAGDFVICSDKTQFIPAFVKLGLVPDTGLTYLLSRSMGAQKALEYCMLGTPIDAQEASKMKMVYSVVSSEHVDEEAMGFAKRLVDGPLIAYANIKKQIFACNYADYEAYLKNVEVPTQNECAKTMDFVEGIKAFKEKRKPVFGKK